MSFPIGNESCTGHVPNQRSLKMNMSEIDRESIGEQIRKGTFRLPRRSVMKTAALATAGASAGLLPMMGSARAATVPVADTDVLNFALNLEYLEANYYLLGVTGAPLPTALTNGGPVPTYPANPSVPFQTPQLAGYFDRIAADEQAHVSFLLDALGTTAVQQPQINLSTAFTELAIAANLITAGQTFNPFASEIDFIIGAYIFEDVGVTAYAGGAAYLQLNGPNVPYAASILAMEGYHAGAIRGYLASQGGGAVTNAISGLRSSLSGGGDDNGTDLSASGGNPFNIVNADSNGQVYRRTFNQVLSVVYGSNTAGTTNGLFFPAGVNGQIADPANTYTNQNG